MGVAGESMPLVFEGVIMIQERCTVVSCVMQGVLSQLLSEVPCGTEAHGDMMWSCVLWVQWYTSDQSKTIRIAVPAVMGGRPDSP